MSSTETFQISAEAAEVYEAQFVPALFAQWAPWMVEAVAVKGADRVLDVACGTGIVAREAAKVAGARVTGVDLNPAMLAVASRVAPKIDWREGDAQALPFPDAAFDVVVCQSALMFFPDRERAVAEMVRVLKPGGRIGLQVWALREEQPGYGPLIDVAARHAGPEAVDLLSFYWTLGDTAGVAALIERAGASVTSTKSHLGTAQFPSIEAMVRTEVEATPLAERIDEPTYRAIIDDTRVELARFENADGSASVPISGHVITGVKS